MTCSLITLAAANSLLTCDTSPGQWRHSVCRFQESLRKTSQLSPQLQYLWRPKMTIMRRVVSPAQSGLNSTVLSASRSVMHLQTQSRKSLTRLSGMGATTWALSLQTIVYQTAWPTILHLRQENKQLRMPKQLHKPTLMWDFWLLSILLITDWSEMSSKKGILLRSF